jgi:hypothetical protein
MPCLFHSLNVLFAALLLVSLIPIGLVLYSVFGSSSHALPLPPLQALLSLEHRGDPRDVNNSSDLWTWLSCRQQDLWKLCLGVHVTLQLDSAVGALLEEI